MHQGHGAHSSKVLVCNFKLGRPNVSKTLISNSSLNLRSDIISKKEEKESRKRLGARFVRADILQ